MTTLYPYQTIGVYKIEKFNGRALLADEMGLGKTIQALTWAKRHKEVKPVIVICPATLKENWQREAARHVGLRAEILESRTVSLKAPGLATPPIYIINYEIVGAWLEFLQNLDPGLVIIDECHYIMNRQAKRSKWVRKLCKYVPHIIALSGTPLVNKPAELWNVLNLLRPDLYPSFTPYAMKHCKPTRTPWGWQFKGAEKMDELHADLKDHMMIRRLKSQVLKHLPPKTHSVIPLPIVQREEYTKAETDFVKWLYTNNGPKAKKALKATALAKISQLKQLSGKLKLPSVMNWIDGFLEESDGKLIVFAWHTQIIHDLHERYKKKSVLVYGGTPLKDRQKAFDQFQSKAQTRLFIGNIQAAGVGWNGTVASTVAFAELAWSPGAHAQAADRVHRIGQSKPSNIFWLIAKNTIEEKLCKVIQEKQMVLDAALDGGARENEMNVFDQLEQEMMKDATRKAGKFVSSVR